ncbi:MAG: Beta-lactamase class C-like and penicillin binding proteins (PBPs) superfamily [uncultured Thermomicrobiales bacterium]|uniref:Beta-lactamase class C-like and penicillin binding proteins (PBPs) superfamily n=1 Tax=uncultured Thermomicrobiales bacterium TaxID=1645740 RepID=A0A6J4UHB1_9BACT|nr:MAG: Beta-lactamase class C-like and penicillin binding proteins (PBPs) superfamily [uncultured Thermomicrobiales bacterium]
MSSSPGSSVDALREALAYVDSWIEYRVWKLRTPGVQVAVWFDGAIQFSKAYGVSNLETHELLTSSHLFRVASHSKTFTATAIMQLVEAGRLRLDDTAGMWIPELKESGSPLADVTVRELVSHSAGVIRDGIDATFWAHNRPFPEEKALLEMSIQEGVVRQPEATFKYTNIGFSLLGIIISKAAGRTYNEYTTTVIIDKLGLRNTGPELDEARLSEYAGGHSGLGSWTERRVIPHVDTHAMAAATGFYSTAEDMVHFASAHFFGDDRLISDRSKNEMQRPVWTGQNPDVPQDGYGYGTTVQHYGGHRMVGHSGGYPGHITRTMWDSKEGLAISVLTNAVDGPAEEVAAGILKILDKARDVSPKMPLSSGLVNSAELPPPETPHQEIDPDIFTGRFAALWGVTDVCILGGKLFASSPVGPSPMVQPSELAVIDENTLRIMSGSPFASVGELFRYERDADGKTVSLFTGGMRAWPIADYRARDRVL